MKIKELKEMTNEELATQRRDLKHETINLRVQQQSGQLENPARIRTVRRTVARIESILSSRRLGDSAIVTENG
ncbi:MAG: 50S ribosomal protein L29 [Verrucomicrobiales bacterium]